MKKSKIIFTVLFLVAMFFAINTFAKQYETQNLQDQSYLAKPTTRVVRTLSNINNWSYWMYYDGKSGITPGGESGGTYPRGTATAIFADGFVWGGYVDGQIRVGGQTYAIGTQAGWIKDDGTAVSQDDPRVKIYRIRSDYKTLTKAMVLQDAAELNMVPVDQVTDAMAQAVIDQYVEDWETWPGDLGAPYIDKNGNGVWDGSDVDEPGIAKADQVVWFVCNDLDVTSAEGLYGSPPIGIELQVTAWGYNQPSARIGQLIFKKYKLINKSGKDVTDMYAAQWCDPDLGEAGDDLVGCDTTLSMGFVYNGPEVDNKYLAFELAPAAMGYDFFQGPLLDGVAGEDLNKNGIDDSEDYAVFNLEKVGPGKINLPMTTFAWFAAGSAISDPTLHKYEGTLQWYNMLRGYIPTDDIDNPTPWHIGNDPNKPVTKYPMAGDPVTETGDLDDHDQFFSPGDRRLGLCTGPFTFADGDTQEVVVAIVGGIGSDRLSSVADMKLTDAVAQTLYDGLFEEVPKAPPAPVVKAIPFEDKIKLDWGSDLDAVSATEDFTVAGYTFEGYVLYQLPSMTAPKSQAKRIATFDLINNVKTIWDKRFLADYGKEVVVPLQYGKDTGVQHHFTIEKDYLNGRRLYEGSTYYFAVTAYNKNLDPGRLSDAALESALIVTPVVVQEPVPGNAPAEEIDNEYELTHSAGTCDGGATYKIIDPYELTGHDYEVFFDQQHYYMDVDGKWKKTNYPDSVGKALGKVADLTGTTISGIAYTSPTAGTRDLKFILDLVAPDYDYSDGVKLILPSDIVINSAENAIGNTYGSVFTPEIDLGTNSVFWGGPDTTGDGEFCGGEVFTVNVNTPILPLDVDYIVWDDGWATAYGPPYDTLGAGVVHAVGTCTITEEAYAFKTVNHWNVKDITTSEVVLEDQTVVGGIDLETGLPEIAGAVGIVDGFQVAINASYDAPTDYTTYTHTGPNRTTPDVFSHSRANAWLNYDQWGKPFCITSYADHGWGETALASDPGCWGCGTSDMNLLQQDVELRFTGEYDTPVTTASGLVYIPVKEGTGSMATIVGARGYDIADHPANPNPGSSDYFPIRIPFEVWNVDTEEQIDIIIYDRLGSIDAGDTLYAFNPSNRMYCYILNRAYSEVAADADGADCEYLTWNLVFWNCDWTKGDKVVFQYDNPIQLGLDKFAFTTNAPTLGDKELAKEDVKKINVYPNPYYAYNSQSTNIFDNFVTFTHLPEKATIRIFTLAGIEVRKLEKNDPSQFVKWDLHNESDLPVASGMYIVYVDMPDLGKDKILKLSIIQGKQVLEYY